MAIDSSTIALIQKDPEMTRQQMVEILDKDIRTIGRAIAKLQQAGYLKRVGSDKTGHWKIVADKNLLSNTISCYKASR